MVSAGLASASIVWKDGKMETAERERMSQSVSGLLCLREIFEASEAMLIFSQQVVFSDGLQWKTAVLRSVVCKL